MNPAQLRVIYEEPQKNLCIIACAGSGKTTTIIHRIAHLIQYHKTNAQDIILTTFTRNAAHDMLVRLRAVCGDAANGINVGTLDALSQRAMRYQHRMRGDDTKYDFSQYQRLFYEFLCTDEGQEYAASFSYFFFDEFQDANEIQYKILCEFHRAGVVVTVIGDDCQNIYSFRGSNMKYLIEFPLNFRNTALHMLNYNYRSSPEIVALANESIQNNPVQMPKKMIPMCKSYEWRGKPMKPVVQYLDSVYDECDAVVHWVKREYSHYIVSHKLHEICIISHSHKPLRIIETALCRAGVPCVYIDNDDKQYVEGKYYHNKVFICTVHQSKGLEWSVVFCVGFSDHYFPLTKEPHAILEARRLFYVAVTRAKKALHIMYSGTFTANHVQFGSGVKTFVKSQDLKPYPTRYIQEVSPTNFVFVGGVQPGEFRISEKSGLEIKTTVTDLLRCLTESDYDALRECFFIDEWCSDQLYESRKHTTAVKYNYAQTLFGQFVENLLHRMFGNYKCPTAEGIINFYPLEMHENQVRNAIIERLGIEIKVWLYTSDDSIKAIMRSGDFTTDQIMTCLMMLEKIRRHAEGYGIPPECVFICPRQQAPSQEILDRLVAAYNRYKNPNLHWRDILYDIYYVSLSRAAINGRLGAFYSKLTADDIAEYMDMYDDMYNHFVTPALEMNSKAYAAGSINMYMNIPGVDSVYGDTISGEIDMIVNNTLIDVKCYTNNPLTMTNIAQIMVYYHMYMNTVREDGTVPNDTDIISLQIFNPLLGTIYNMSIDLAEMGDRALRIMQRMISSRDAAIDRTESIDDMVLSIERLKKLMNGDPAEEIAKLTLADLKKSHPEGDDEETESE